MFILSTSAPQKVTKSATGVVGYTLVAGAARYAAEQRTTTLSVLSTQ